MRAAFADLQATRAKYNCDLRTAAFVLAVGRIAQATGTRADVTLGSEGVKALGNCDARVTGRRRASAGGVWKRRASMSDVLRNAFNNALCDELAAALGRIAHCVGQLSDEQVWSRPAPSMNSIGSLMLHLAGNVRQLIVAGVGGASDVRERQAEFDTRGPIAADELLGKLLLAAKEARSHRLSERRKAARDDPHQALRPERNRGRRSLHRSLPRPRAESST